MAGAIYVIVLNIVTDMVPYFSILELKFIEIFTKNAEARRRVRGNGVDLYDVDLEGIVKQTEAILHQDTGSPSMVPKYIISQDDIPLSAQ
jgi:hypothetical protein